MVTFRRGTQQEFDNLLIKDPDTLYFITDTFEIYKGNIHIASNNVIQVITLPDPAEGLPGKLYLQGASDRKKIFTLVRSGTEYSWLDLTSSSVIADLTLDVFADGVVVTSISDESTDDQIPTAKAVHDALSGIHSGVQSVTAGTGLSGGTITENGTISHSTPSGASAGSVGDSSSQTPDWGDTFQVLFITTDELGHVTVKSSHSVTIPSSSFLASTLSAPGSVGLVPAPPATIGAGYYLDATGAWINLGDLLSAVFKFRGSVDVVSGATTGQTELPLTDNHQGDVWHVNADDSEYVWTSSESSGTISDWEELGLTVSLAGYATENWVSGNFIPVIVNPIAGHLTTTDANGKVTDSGVPITSLPANRTTPVYMVVSAEGLGGWATPNDIVRAASQYAATTAGTVPAYDPNSDGTHNEDILVAASGWKSLKSLSNSNDFTGAGVAAGTHGLVPGPAIGDDEKYLKGDGTWGTPPGNTPAYGEIILSTSWTTESNEWFSQVVTLQVIGVLADSEISLQFSKSAIDQLDSDGCISMFAENNQGVVTVYAKKHAPTASMTVQYTLDKVQHFEDGNEVQY